MPLKGSTMLQQISPCLLRGLWRRHRLSVRARCRCPSCERRHCLPLAARATRRLDACEPPHITPHSSLFTSGLKQQAAQSDPYETLTTLQRVRIALRAEQVAAVRACVRGATAPNAIGPVPAAAAGGAVWLATGPMAPRNMLLLLMLVAAAAGSGSTTPSGSCSSSADASTWADATRIAEIMQTKAGCYQQRTVVSARTCHDHSPLLPPSEHVYIGRRAAWMGCLRLPDSNTMPNPVWHFCKMNCARDELYKNQAHHEAVAAGVRRMLAVHAWSAAQNDVVARAGRDADQRARARLHRHPRRVPLRVVGTAAAMAAC